MRSPRNSRSGGETRMNIEQVEAQQATEMTENPRPVHVMRVGQKQRQLLEEILNEADLFFIDAWHLLDEDELKEYGRDLFSIRPQWKLKESWGLEGEGGSLALILLLYGTKIVYVTRSFRSDGQDQFLVHLEAHDNASKNTLIKRYLADAWELLGEMKEALADAELDEQAEADEQATLEEERRIMSGREDDGIVAYDPNREWVAPKPEK